MVIYTDKFSGEKSFQWKLIDQKETIRFCKNHFEKDSKYANSNSIDEIKYGVSHYPLINILHTLKNLNILCYINRFIFNFAKKWFRYVIEKSFPGTLPSIFDHDFRSTSLSVLLWFWLKIVLTQNLWGRKVRLRQAFKS